MTKAATADKTAPEISASLPLMLRMFKTYVRPRLKTIAFAMVLMMISAAMTGIMAKLMEPVIDKVFADKDAAMLWPVALGVLAVFTLRGAANYGQNVLMNMLGQRIVSDMQQDLFAHLVYADLAFLQKEYSGQLISRFLSDINTIRMAAVQSLTGIGKNLFTVVFLIIVMFMQDWKLAASSLFVFPAAAWSVSLLGKKLRKVSASTQVSMGDFSSALGQAFQGARHIKSYGMEEHEKLRVFSYINRVCKLMNRSYRFSAIATPVGEVLSGVAIVTIIVYGGHEVITGGSTAGKLFSFITAFLLAFEPMKRLAQLNNSMQMGLAGMERLFSLLDMKPEITDKPGAKDLALKDSTVRFDDVVFAYPDGTLALNGLSFTAPTGKTVALVGESGAGKSTILNLIPRFYDVSEGAVLVDGQDVRDVTMRSLRANMALVSQEVAIFTDTLRENIAYGRPDATEEEIIAAAKLAAAHDFIMEQPQGYDTRVGEQGVKLSGGQRQRISIARAMLRNAPILLLDEATSALDANSERLVQSAIDRLQKGRTTIVVAHRLSTIMDADIIYVMSQGRVVESGSHDALLKSGGAYARLYGTLMRETA